MDVNGDEKINILHSETNYYEWNSNH